MELEVEAVEDRQVSRAICPAVNLRGREEGGGSASVALMVLPPPVDLITRGPVTSSHCGVYQFGRRVITPTCLRPLGC